MRLNKHGLQKAVSIANGLLVRVYAAGVDPDNEHFRINSSLAIPSCLATSWKMFNGRQLVKETERS